LAQIFFKNLYSKEKNEYQGICMEIEWIVDFSRKLLAHAFSYFFEQLRTIARVKGRSCCNSAWEEEEIEK